MPAPATGKVQRPTVESLKLITAAWLLLAAEVHFARHMICQCQFYVCDISLAQHYLQVQTQTVNQF